MARRVGCSKDSVFYKGKCRTPKYVLDPHGKKIWTSKGENIEMWSPNRFLSVVPLPEGLKSKRSIERMKEAMLMHKPLDPLYIDLRPNEYPKGWLPDHEGRHRALVAGELGINKVPVAVMRGN